MGRRRSRRLVASYANVEEILKKKMHSCNCSLLAPPTPQALGIFGIGRFLKGKRRAPPPPPPPQIITIDVSPQISPVFQQMQDSPGSGQAGAPSFEKTGASGSADTTAILKFMREQDERRRADEAAQRVDAQRIAAEDNRRRDAAEAQSAAFARERQAFDRERSAAQQMREDQIAAERHEALLRAGARAVDTIAPAPQTISIDMPSAPLPIAQADAFPITRTLNWPLVIGGVVVAGGAAYLFLGKRS